MPTRERTTRPKFSLAQQDPRVSGLIGTTGHRTLGVWARDCAERVLRFFEQEHPRDPRPRAAIDALEAWIDTGEFRMATIRGASLGAHAAAREVGGDTPARSAARSAGQAVATAHVRTHSVAAANYAVQAIHRAADPADAGNAIAAERDWQYHRLLELRAAAHPGRADG